MAGSRMFTPREACLDVFRLSPNLFPVLPSDCLNCFQLSLSRHQVANQELKLELPR